MSYIIVGIVRGLKYFVQHKDGDFILNGLENNAHQYKNESEARTPKQEFSKKFKIPMLIKQIHEQDKTK